MAGERCASILCWPKGRLYRYALILVSFLIILIPRVVKLGRVCTVDETSWSMRGKYFIENVAAGNFAETAIKAHPGVTVMWIAGPAGYLASGIDFVKMGGSIGQFLAAPIQTSCEHAITTRQYALKIRQTCVAVVNSLVSMLACVWLGMALNSGLIVVLSALLVGLDPFYFGLSRIVHCDALMATFVIASCTAMFRFLFSDHFAAKWIMISGALAGLGILSKITGAVIIPWSVLVLFVFAWFHFAPATRPPLSRFGASVRWMLPKVVLWGVTLVLVFVAVWPAMWVEPGKVLGLLIRGARIAAHHVHPSISASLAQQHVGISSYLPRILIFSAPWIVWVFVVGAAFFLFFFFASLQNKRVWSENQSVPADNADRFRWIFISCALLFLAALNIICLGLFQKQAGRYILVSIVAIDLVAVIVLGSVISICRVNSKFLQRMIFGLLIILVLWCGHTAYKWIPYATGYRHPLWGNILVDGRHLLRGWGEGIEEAAKVLNRMGGSEELIVAARHSWILKIFFNGIAVEYNKMLRHKVDYIILYETLWDSNQNSRLVTRITKNCVPLKTIYLKPFGKIPMVRIYESSCYYEN